LLLLLLLRCQGRQQRRQSSDWDGQLVCITDTCEVSKRIAGALALLRFRPPMLQHLRHLPGTRQLQLLVLLVQQHRWLA
jgi:hypothetical protein